MYIPQDHYLWDFWLLRRPGAYHLFYLQAPRDLPNPEMRHALATVGHAISPNLRDWDYQGTVLQPGPKGSWDDRAIWTGSLSVRGKTFYMLYTGTCLEEGGKIQRIGLAVSRDLIHWDKHPANPLIEADPRWYGDERASPFSERAWRDPYVIHCKPENAFYSFITARTKEGPVKSQGCIALARSGNLVDWEVLPPLRTPHAFLQMEVPQCVSHEGRCYLLFSVDKTWCSGSLAAHIGAPPATGTYYMVSRTLHGAYSEVKLLLGDEIGSYYGAKLVQEPDGGWVILSWLGQDKDGRFIGGLSDPKPVRFLAEGTLKAV